MSRQKAILSEVNKTKIEMLEKSVAELCDEMKEMKTLSQNPSSEEDESKSLVTTLQLEKANHTIAELQKKIDEQNIELRTLKINLEEKESSAFQREYEGLKTRCNDLEEEVEKRKKIIHELNSRISELEIFIGLEKHAVEIKKTKHAETKKLLDNTLATNERMQKATQLLPEDQKIKDDKENEREKENKRYLEQIDNLTAQLFDMDEKLSEREKKVKELMHEVDALKKKSVSQPILKEQPDGPALQDPVIVGQCPICFETFENAATCEAHALKCLDKDGKNECASH